MIEHILFPGVDFTNFEAFDTQIEKYLKAECAKFEDMALKKCFSISQAMNAYLAQRTLGLIDTRVIDAVEANLVEEERCFAYTQQFAGQLYNFETQWKQNDVYTEYNHFLLRRFAEIDIAKTKAVSISRFIDDKGIAFNNANSDTILRYRMNSEVYMQTLMASEIMGAKYADSFKNSESFNVSSPYISAEYFRYRILRKLSRHESFPSDHVETLISMCRAEVGLCDFNAKQKVDDFMGAKKRTERDQTLFSPIATLQGIYLLNEKGLKEQAQQLIEEVQLYYDMYGIDLPSFRMRDLPIPFGPGTTIPECLALNGILMQ